MMIVVMLSIATPVAASTGVPGGDVSGTWALSGSPYLINGDITVPAGQTLTIEPGVVVNFESAYDLTVNGTLLAEGTESTPILFGGGHETAGWGGIRMIAASDDSRLTYVVVEKGRATSAYSTRLGGGIYVENSSPTISDSTIRDNYATLGGGGIALVNSNAILMDNSILNNSAGQGGSASGGGIYMTDSNPQLTRNTIRGNSIGVAGSFSTPTALGGGIYAYRSSPVLRYNVISDNQLNASSNSHARGGGLYFYFGAPDLINNTITGNSVTESYSEMYDREGGGIYLYGSDLTIVNTVLWNNTPEQIFVSDFADLTVAYSDIQDGQAGITIEGNPTLNNAGGNINADPLFVDPANGDFNLQAGSPAIDAGTAYFAWNGQVLVDLSPSEYVGAAPDMGAFEYGDGGGQNQPPVAVAAVDPDHGSAPLTVQFSSDGSYDPDGTIGAYDWTFGDGGTSSEANPSYTYANIGTYQATLTVTDDDGATHSDVVTIDVVDGTTIWGGGVYGTWDLAGSPYRIEGDVTVPAGQTLTIEPGVVVNFESAYDLTVNGTLLAEGTESAPILFGGGHETAGWGGIRMVDASDSSLLSYVTVEKGRATSAYSTRLGGGIYIENSSPTISDSTIRDNYATLGGGGIALVNSDAVLMDNSILNNSAGQGGSASGGGIYMTDSNPQLTRNTIRGNSIGVAGSFSTPTGLGGGIYAYRSSPVLRYNVVSDNQLNASSNSHARGGGLYFYFGAPDLVNNTITGNSVTESYSEMYDREGGGIYLYGSDLTIVNTVLWNNTPEQIFVSDFADLTVAYSDIQDGLAGIVIEGSPTLNDAGGNIDADPLFVDPASGDFNLQAGSPAIDAGTAYFAWQGRVLVDLSPDQYVGSAPDMGALESEHGGTSNQPPVAVASASPLTGEAPLTVQFSSNGSYDPDGAISAYAWGFGDGSGSSDPNPSYTYNSAGTYQATLTVTDDDDATDTAVLTIEVTAAAQDELHVGDQVVTRQKYRRFARGIDTVLILDQNDQPVTGATVTATYSGPNSGQVSGTTGVDGTVVLRTPWTRKTKDLWCFEVTDVSKDGYTYNTDANVVTIRCESS